MKQELFVHKHATDLVCLGSAHKSFKGTASIAQEREKERGQDQKKNLKKKKKRKKNKKENIILELAALLLSGICI